MSFSKSNCWFVIAALGVALVGCSGGPNYPTATLAGKVTIDGKPMENGRMQFIPQEDQQAHPTFVEVSGGSYRVDDAPVGKITVTFTATELVGEKQEYDQTLPVYKNLVARKYRDGITIEIQGDDASRDFSLTSK
ncbi:MAG: hypothetical protein MI757_18495 [Pirellulales bacterium]|nr:hypothetical protein [Pirellulales bacterium]